MNDPETMENPDPEMSQEPPPETPTETSESPTYKHDQWYGLDHYICLRCGHEDWSEPTLTQHMQAYHQGQMVEAPPGYAPPPVADEEPVSDEAPLDPPVPVDETTEGGSDG